MTDGVSRPIPALALVASVCALLAIVGSMGPWARALFVTKNGTDGDGVLTLLLGIAALVVSGVRTARPDQWRRAGWVAVVSVGLAALIGAYDWSKVSDVAGQAGGRRLRSGRLRGLSHRARTGGDRSRSGRGRRADSPLLRSVRGGAQAGRTLLRLV